MMRVSCFGYRTDGPPSDADLIIDCRGIPNPHSMHLTDDEKRAWTLSHPLAEGLLSKGLFHMMNGGKHVAFGCMFGRHRSYALAVELRKRVDEYDDDGRSLRKP